LQFSLVIVIVAAIVGILISMSGSHVSSDHGTTTTNFAPPTSLPVSSTQSTDEPPSTSTALANRLAPLWLGIVTNNAVSALADVVPETVYAVLEADHVKDAVAAYVSEVEAPFQLDIESYHAAVGARSVLTSVRTLGAPRWTRASVCGTADGYWLLPAVDLTYSNGSRAASVVVVDLVSWRGIWYVGRFGSAMNIEGTEAVVTTTSGDGVKVCPISPSRLS
jgi:hypothetical protein